MKHTATALLAAFLLFSPFDTPPDPNSYDTSDTPAFIQSHKARPTRKPTRAIRIPRPIRRNPYMKR